MKGFFLTLDRTCVATSNRYGIGGTGDVDKPCLQDLVCKNARNTISDI